MERLKIFLSSTQIDLQRERDCADVLVSKLGHECWRAETLDAPGCSPLDACKTMAEQCDIYLGIFGCNYGFRVPQFGISATEMEYQTARTADPRKIFIYIKDEEVQDADQKRFLERVQEFSTGYVRHPKFGSLEELEAQMYGDIVTWTAQQVREAKRLQKELHTLRDKDRYKTRTMKRYKVPGYLSK